MKSTSASHLLRACRRWTAARGLSAAGALLTAALLAGCAAQTAFREAQDLQATGRTEAALQKYEQAWRLEPSSGAYRLGYLRTRDQLLDQWVAQGDAARQQSRHDEAERAYRQALTLLPTHERALQGLRQVEQQRRWDTWFKEAETAYSRKDLDTAQLRLRTLLLENQQHAGARRLMQKIESETARPTPAESGLSAAFRKPISIEFKDASLRNVFDVISRTSGLNFLFDKDVKTDQKTSIYLKNSTIEAAINLTLLTQQLDQRVLDANTILIYPNTQAKQKDYQSLTVKSYYLTNADAKSVANSLKAILKSRDVVVEEKLNLLIIRDTPEAIRMADKLVMLHDVQDSEVMLEVEILEVKRTRLLDLGVRWPDQLSLSPLPAATGGTVTLADLRDLQSSRIGATVGALTIAANKSDTDANILANPRIRTRNREKAKILIGERVPNITTTSTSTGFVSESVTYVDVGLKLDVEPTIYPDGEVAIKVALEVSNIINQVQTKNGALAYQIGTRTAQTVLRLKDGENQVLAGLINDEDRRTANKVPALGDVPIAGRLFGRQADDTSKTEIVLSITPRVVRNTVRPEAGVLEFDSGTESSLGVRGSGGGAATVAVTSSSNRTDTNNRTPAAANAGTGAGNNLNNVNGVNGVGTGVGSNLSNNSGLSTGGVAGNVGTGGVTAPATAVLTWQGPTQLKVGDNFTAQLIMSADQPLISAPLSIGFDPRAIQVVSVAEGDFLRQGGAQTSFNSRIDPAGQVIIAASRATETGASSPGAVVTLNLKVIGAPSAETRLQLLAINPTATGGRSVTAPLPTPLVVVLQP
ncbi:secretin N-terminal domain-containing protein [Roseateles amylovorans]|uniref:Cohesin domain-containing protein n=1 Tax=Roseateles amylovorans TaxID=2978473 RepID=A0ABY6AT08_9BURK|nr:secretin N-terminal domain-containing protein [Roseateles amylovorans]UXH76058.1 cohesin domain-containing protein [Roseateles amylovorans]